MHGRPGHLPDGRRLRLRPGGRDGADEVGEAVQDGEEGQSLLFVHLLQLAYELFLGFNPMENVVTEELGDLGSWLPLRLRPLSHVPIDQLLTEQDGEVLVSQSAYEEVLLLLFEA